MLLDSILNPIVSPDHAVQLQYRSYLYLSNKSLQSRIKVYKAIEIEWWLCYLKDRIVLKCSADTQEVYMSFCD